jgi:hypothetical protein
MLKKNEILLEDARPLLLLPPTHTANRAKQQKTL